MPSLDTTDFLQHEDTADLISEASRCVACGLCLPHCPTYRKTRSEADSPRGRIMLIKGVLEQRIPLNDKFVRHIDLCLTCRACESACPSKVEYGRLVDGVRPMLKRKAPGAILRRVFANPLGLRLLAPLLRLYRYSGMQVVARKSGLLQKMGLAGLEDELPPISRLHGWREIYPATGKPRGEVGLFLGCIARVADVATLDAAIFVLNRLGYTVHVPKRQACCGAMHQHSGEPQVAGELAQRNIRAFAGSNPAAIISTASGCGATLSEYHLHAGEAAHDFSAKVTDIGAFLAEAEGWNEVAIAPLAAKICVQDPCTLRNVLHGEQAPYALLRRIPQAVVEPLAGNDQCCGAAGMYHVAQPEMATLLRDDKMNAMLESGAQYLATSNIGCAMWLAQGLRERGVNLEVVHPVVLLARQMGFKNK